MKTIIHDFDSAVFEELFPETAQLTRLGTSEPPAVILSPMYPARPCIGCFGCWIKTPGSCVLPDSYQEMGKLLSRTSELILISRCCYGGYSPYVKNVLDRSIGYLQPFSASLTERCTMSCGTITVWQSRRISMGMPSQSWRKRPRNAWRRQMPSISELPAAPCISIRHRNR